MKNEEFNDNSNYLKPAIAFWYGIKWHLLVHESLKCNHTTKSPSMMWCPAQDMMWCPALTLWSLHCLRLLSVVYPLIMSLWARLHQECWNILILHSVLTWSVWQGSAPQPTRSFTISWWPLLAARRRAVSPSSPCRRWIIHYHQTDH